MSLWNYGFHNLLGSTYKGGSVIFSGDGNTVLSPVGNRVNVVDLVHNRSLTLEPENRKDIAILALTKDSRLLMSIDVDGYGLLINFTKGSVLNRINFKDKVKAVRWSPDDQWIAIGVGRHLQIWQAPRLETGWKLNLHRTLGGHLDDITSIEWSNDNKFIVTSGDDVQARVWSIDPYPGFTPTVLSDHRAALRGAFFGKNIQNIHTVSRDGVVSTWVYETEEDAKGLCVPGKWRVENKAFCQQNQDVTKASFHESSGVLLVGFEKGVFALYELKPELSTLHTLSIGNSALDSVNFNATGEWVCCAASETGTLIVWEWQSETYIMKQQGHHHGVNCLAWSPNGVTAGSKAISAAEGTTQIAGTLLATGGYDGKVKLWNTTSGFCFVTFADHTAPISDITFTPQANAVISCSHDGSVRAFDLLRYRNFRTLVSPHGHQPFEAVAIDSGGEIVAAATRGDQYHIVTWSLQTGNVLDTIAGHASSVSSIIFSPHTSCPGQIVTGSWDGTLQVWDIFKRKADFERLQCGASILDIKFDPRGNYMLAASMLGGKIVFWDVDKGQLTGSIEGIRDIQSGRGGRDHTTANNSWGKHKKDDSNTGVNQNQHFSSIAYAASGRLLACSSRNSPHVCLYDTSAYTLTFRYCLTENQSLSGLKVMLNSKNVVGGANTAEFDVSDSDDDAHIKKKRRIDAARALPGVNVGEAKDAYSKEEMHCWGVDFSMDGKEFAVGTSHGVFVYKVQTQNTHSRGGDLHNSALERFAPQMLTENVTTQTVLSALEREQYSKATILALALNDFQILLKVFESITLENIPNIVTSIGPTLLPALLNFLTQCLHPQKGTKHFQHHLTWVETILDLHLSTLMNWQGERTIDINYSKGDVVALLLQLLQQIGQQHQSLKGIFQKNTYLLEYLKLSANNHIAKGGFTMDGMDCFDSDDEVSDDP